MRKGFADEFALFVLDGQQTTRMSTEKSASLRAIAVASEIWEMVGERSLTMDDVEKLGSFIGKRLRKLDRKDYEREFQERMSHQGKLEVVPSILGCDIEYYTAGVDIQEYRADEDIYAGMLEKLRRAILVPGELDEESFIALWLMRECVLYRLVEPKEMKLVMGNAEVYMENSPVCRALWKLEFHSDLEHFVANLISRKKLLMKNPWLQGLAMFMSPLQKEDSIFIDFVVLGTDPAQRRRILREFIAERGHHVSEVVYEGQAMLKIDNRYYHVMPGTKQYRLPVQGAYIVPFYEAVD